MSKAQLATHERDVQAITRRALEIRGIDPRDVGL
jgi:hypothetical protein